MTYAHESQKCGAKNRQGNPCKRPVTPGRNRCHLHGGKSLRGKDHPAYKHGYYSKESKAYRRMLRALIREINSESYTGG